jgi:hypothetical protein
MYSKILDDHQLSREGNQKWLTSAALPPWITYARQLRWPEPWAPSPRCLYGCEVISAITLSAGTDAPGTASRILYLLADDLDGWYPCPPRDETGHGGELVWAKSFLPCSPAEIFTPAMSELELSKWRARRSGLIQYWDRFKRSYKPEIWPELTGVVLPEPPKPRGWINRFLGQ